MQVSSSLSNPPSDAIAQAASAGASAPVNAPALDSQVQALRGVLQSQQNQLQTLQQQQQSLSVQGWRSDTMLGLAAAVLGGVLVLMLVLAARRRQRAKLQQPHALAWKSTSVAPWADNERRMGAGLRGRAAQSDSTEASFADTFVSELPPGLTVTEGDAQIEDADQPLAANSTTPAEAVYVPHADMALDIDLGGAPHRPAQSKPAARPISLLADPEPLGGEQTLLDWDLSSLHPAAAPEPAAPEFAVDVDISALDAGDAETQWQTALALRDLGLWAQARAQVEEILAQPDTGWHAQAMVLLDELAQTAPSSLDALPPITGPR